MNKNCFVCNNDMRRNIGTISNYSLIKCNKCGLESLDPTPDRERLNDIYTDYYRAWGIGTSSEEISLMKSKTFRGYLNKITQHVSSGKLLDIGCATGEFMQAVLDDGFDPYGVEISPGGIELCRKQFGGDKIVDHELTRDDFPDDFFDCITLSDVFEHIENPRPFIDILKCILKKEGILMIVTPNTSSWSRKLTGIKWPHYKEEHVHYYNFSSITRLFSSDFEIVTAEKARKTLTVDYCASILKTYSDSGILRKIADILGVVPGRIRQSNFTVCIGEMFVLMRKRQTGWERKES